MHEVSSLFTGILSWGHFPTVAVHRKGLKLCARSFSIQEADIKAQGHSPVLLSIVMTKHSDQKQPREGKAYLAHTSMSQSIIERNQGTDSRRTWCKELKMRQWKNTAYWPAFHGFYTLRTICPEVSQWPGPSHVNHC